MSKIKNISNIRDVEKLVKKFLRDVFADFDFDIKLEKPLKVYDYEFNELIGFYGSSNRVVNDGVFNDIYNYYLLPKIIFGKCKEITKRLYIKYKKDNEGDYILYHVSGATETEDCEDP